MCNKSFFHNLRFDLFNELLERLNKTNVEMFSNFLMNKMKFIKIINYTSLVKTLSSVNQLFTVNLKKIKKNVKIIFKVIFNKSEK